jgi:type II secretory pathway pseudopilin PulG
MEAVGHNPPALKQGNGRAQKRGFSLVEAAIVLAVVGGVIGGIWTASAKLHQERQLNQAVSDMLIVSNNIRRIYKGFDLSGYIRLDTKAAYDAGIFEGSSIKVNNYNAPSDQILNIRADYLYNGPYGITNRIANYYIVFDMTTKTTEQCIKMVSFISSRLKNDPQLVTINVGGIAGYISFPIIPPASQ